MKNTCTNAYIFQAWLDLINDSHLDPFILIDPSSAQREISVPMDYCVDGLLTLNLSARTLGYMDLDKSTGYLSLSTRFNRIEQHMSIPVESIAIVRSSCSKIFFDMQTELHLLGDQVKDKKIYSPVETKVSTSKSTLTVIR